MDCLKKIFLFLFLCMVILLSNNIVVVINVGLNYGFFGDNFLFLLDVISFYKFIGIIKIWIFDLNVEVFNVLCGYYEIEFIVGIKD